MRERWEALCTRLGSAGDPATLFLLLESLYANPPRAYHSLAHVAACLRLLDEFRSLASSPDEAEFALWLHDCVYDPMRKDNEARSAAVAGVFARELGSEPVLHGRIAGLIDATRHTGHPLSGDAALVADVDTAILGAGPVDYDAYSRAIRQEYAAVPDADYRRGRRAFLESLLSRPHIYHLPALGARFEAPARANIAREAASL